MKFEPLINHLKQSFLLILPGRGGMVISEAMTCGIPVLTSAADGTERDLIKNKLNGYITDGSINSYIKIINFLLKNQSKYDLISKNAADTMKKYNDNYMAREISNVINSSFNIK